MPYLVGYYVRSNLGLISFLVCICLLLRASGMPGGFEWWLLVDLRVKRNNGTVDSVACRSVLFETCSNATVRIGGVEGDLVKRALSTLI